MQHSPVQKALLAGHFSTFGDLAALEYVIAAVRSLGIQYDTFPMFGSEFLPHMNRPVPARGRPDPGEYSHLFVICGPLWPGLLEERGLNLADFGHAIRVGVNLSMIEPLDQWNPFHILIERDSGQDVRPDVAFSHQGRTGLVAGLCIIDSQPEYGANQRHAETLAMFDEAVASNGWAKVLLDTRWPPYRNKTGLSSADDFMSVVRRVDFVLTNRLHGMVFSLSAGTPVIAVDSVAGGAKLTAQANAIGWPVCKLSEDASVEWISSKAEWALDPSAGEQVAKSVRFARDNVDRMQGELVQALRETEYFEKPIGDSAPVTVARSGPRRLLGSARRRLKGKLHGLVDRI